MTPGTFLSASYLLAILFCGPFVESFLLQDTQQFTIPSRIRSTRPAGKTVESRILKTVLEPTPCYLQQLYMTSGNSGGPLESKQQKQQHHQQLMEEFYAPQDRFCRWRFLQDVLEGDADVDIVNQVLYQVLDGALKYPRPDGNSGGDIVPLPVEVQETITKLLDDKDMIQNGSVMALLEDYDDDVEPATERLRRLEELLPTSDDDEDAVKSLWDTVMELYGREAVKYQETQDNTLEWKLTNTVVRLLLHFDFLTLGIVRAPLK